MSTPRSYSWYDGSSTLGSSTDETSSSTSTTSYLDWELSLLLNEDTPDITVADPDNPHTCPAGNSLIVPQPSNDKPILVSIPGFVAQHLANGVEKVKVRLPLVAGMARMGRKYVNYALNTLDDLRVAEAQSGKLYGLEMALEKMGEKFKFLDIELKNEQRGLKILEKRLRGNFYE